MKRGIITLALLILLATPLILAQNTTEDLNAKTENILERQITSPPILKVPLEIILGIKEDATWQQLIIVLGVFIGFFIVIFSIVDFLPFFKEGWIKVLASLVITALVSITGVLEILAIFIYDIAGFFKWTAAWNPLQTILAILFTIIIIVVANKVSDKLKHKMKVEKAGSTAKNINLVKKVGEVEEEILES